MEIKNLSCATYDNHLESKQTGSLTSFNDYLNSKEAALYLKITEATLRNMCSNGQVPYYKLGRRNRFLKKDLDSIMSRVNGKDIRYGN